MTNQIITVCHCEACGEPVDVPIKKLGQLISGLRKTNNTPEFMRQIALKRHADNRNKNALKNKTP